MSILLDSRSRILVHGNSTPLARYQCSEMLRLGTGLAGTVGTCSANPLAGVPHFATTAEAVAETGAEVSLVFNQGLDVLVTVCAVIDAGIGLIICLSEDVPVHDCLLMGHRARQHGALLIGPGSTGVLSPGKAKAGFFCESLCIPGDIGIVTKSGSVGYAVMSELKDAGMGISTVVGLGGGAVKGTDFCWPLKLFESDSETRAIVMLGEIGGNDEERAADYISSAIGKPVVAFVAGRSVPPGQSMGHAGAITRRGHGDYASKIKHLQASGIRIASNLGEIARLLKPPSP